MTTSNTELATMARKYAAGLSNLAGWHRRQDHPRTVEGIERAADLLRQLADAVESKAEPVAEYRADGTLHWLEPYPVKPLFPPNGYLYTAPVQPEKDERKPLTQSEVVEGFCATPHNVQYVAVFDAGVRFAERAHGIGSNTEGGGDE